MLRADVIYLIGETPEAHGVFDDTVTKEYRQVFCEVNSIGRTEAYQAMSTGLNPEYMFRIPLADDYEGEHYLTFHGIVFRVIRTYVNGDSIELTCERSVIPDEQTGNGA